MKLPKRLMDSLAILAAGMLSVGLVGFSGKPTERNDGQIESAIQQRLDMDKRIHGNRIEVAVENHRAKLFGTVRTPEEKKLASKLASSVIGVQGVLNALRVKPTVSRSREIENTIKERLRHVGLLETLRVQFDDGTVILEGAVKARHDRQTAERAVAAVEGVVEVENLIQVSGDGRSDDAIERDIATHLLWSPLVNFDDIRVQVDDGVVTLEGSVEHLGYRDVLAIDIQNILGVERVDVSKIVPKPLKAFPTAKAEKEYARK